MKKHLIAAAVAAAVSAPAMAQVTVGGTLDTSLGTGTAAIPVTASGDFRTDGSRSATSTATRSVSQVQNSFWSSSNINFKGSEDLGGGLKASFHVEGGVNTDTGSSDLANRVTQVGVSGAFGTVNLGRGSTALNDAATSGGHGIGNFANLPFLAPSRPNNAVNYISPTFNGFSARLTMGEGESTGATTKNDAAYTAASLHGKVGALSFVVGQATNKQQRAATTGRAFVFNSSNAVAQSGVVSIFSTDATTGLFSTTFPGPATTLTDDARDGMIVLSISQATAAVDGKTKDTFLAADYNFGPVHARFQHVRSKSSGTVADGLRVMTIDQTVNAFTLLAPMGASTLFVNYQNHDRSGDRKTTSGSNSITTLSTAERTTDKNTVLAFGVNYALSKRTNVYVVHRDTDNDAGSKYNSGVDGKNAKSTALGVRHSF